MKLLNPEQIVIPDNRQRREFKEAELNELAESIATIGLLHPIVVREHENRFLLVAGERRLRAIKDLFALGRTFPFEGATCDVAIPAVFLGQLDPLAAEEAELEENVRRVDLTWQERAAATSRLNALRGKQASSQGLPPPPVAAIAEEVRGSSEGKFQETTRREIIVAKHLDDPEVRGAKSVDEAFKLLRRKEETKRNIQLAETVGRTFSSSMHRAFNEDAIEWLRRSPNSYFDVICCDPPYGMGADEFGDAGGRAQGAHSYADDADSFRTLLSSAAPELGRVCKEQAHLYMFCDLDGFHFLRELFTAQGWWVHRTPLIWHKTNGSRVPWPEHGPQRKYELVLYAVRGKKPVTKIYPDVLSYPTEENLGHPAQKPVAVYLDLLRRSVKPGDQVLDWTMGSGPIFPACHELKCVATGIELDPAHYAIALKRIKALDAQREFEEALF